MLQIEIDGKQIEVPDGSTIMDAAHQVGIEIPHFCYHKKLSIAANCRMCLVQVEKAPKPLPACATPVTDGMKVMTHSDAAVKAQKGVMEFLLINHPLDCPICDEGGECQLQDLAVGYGASSSRYQEEKRVVLNKNLGPLISTDMTRCIHCSRCVRFGQEIAGIMELGMGFRGEHTEVMTFMQHTVDSELSGNVIDLCPVGALTNKPFRYSARSWELGRRKAVSPHDGLGSNLSLHVKDGKVLRVVPAENEDINECWLADRDRYSYEGLYSEERLTKPMIRRDGTWRECEWQEALEYVAAGLRHIQADHGPAAIGALATPHQTVEELYLLQKMINGLGSANIDHRLRQFDFSADGALHGTPWLGTSVASLQEMDRILVIGSTLRKDHPLLAHRLRQAVKAWAQLNLVNPVDDDLLTQVDNKAIVSPSAMVNMLAQVLKALAEAKSVAVPANVADVTVSDVAKDIAASLASGERKAVLLGNLAQHHPQSAQLHVLAQDIAALCGASVGFLGEAANSVGACLVGALPSANGLNAKAMLDTPRKAYVLLGVEAELDCYDPAKAMKALQSAELVVALTAYKHKALDYAHVLLPIAPFAETSGTFISTEGRVQSFNGATKPLGESRPAWKVLRVLGNLLELEGFDYESSEAVRTEAFSKFELPSALNNQLKAGAVTPNTAVAQNGLQRIGEVPIYQMDAVVRRASSLQKTHDAAAPVAWMHSALLEKLGLKEGAMVNLRQGDAAVALPATRDDRLPQDCVRVAAAHPLTAGLGGMLDAIIVERAS
jgi:NADH-quinone oxidoreductase subunit G